MEAIKIRKTTIDIPFQNENGEVVETLRFDKSDDNIEKLRKTAEELETKLEELKNNPSSDKSKEYIAQMFDVLFGKGAFTKIYAISPSLQIMIIYLAQIAQNIIEEEDQQELEALVEKYRK